MLKPRLYAGYAGKVACWAAGLNVGLAAGTSGADWAKAAGGLETGGSANGSKKLGAGWTVA
eukprot:29527_2